MPSLQGFIARTRRVDKNIELYIAGKRGTLNKHLSKWEKLINVILTIKGRTIRKLMGAGGRAKYKKKFAQGKIK